jgi:hypothetical protein
VTIRIDLTPIATLLIALVAKLILNTKQRLRKVAPPPARIAVAINGVVASWPAAQAGKTNPIGSLACAFRKPRTR